MTLKKVLAESIIIFLIYINASIEVNTLFFRLINRYNLIHNIQNIPIFIYELYVSPYYRVNKTLKYYILTCFFILCNEKSLN